MDTKLLKEIKFYLMPGKPIDRGFAWRDLYERTAEYWEHFWTELLKGNGAHIPSMDELLRQDCVSVLALDREIVALHCYSFYNLALRPARKHPYFQYYTDAFMAQLRQRQAEQIMTMEYFTANPNYRASKVGISFASILAQLGFMWAREAGVDGVITVARNDVPSSKIAAQLGGQILERDCQIHNTPCDLFFFQPDQILFEQESTVRQLVSDLWASRIDATKSPRTFKVAA